MNKRFLYSAFALVLASVFVSHQLAAQTAGYKYSPPERLEDGIQTGTLKENGFDEAKIVVGINEMLAGTYPNIHSVLIFRDGRLVLEEYFTGEDVERGVGPKGVVTHTRDTLHDMRSVTKSVVAASVLIAHSQGKIRSLDQPLFDLFPEFSKHAEGDKKRITLKHVLSMSAGLDWNENISYADPANSEIQMERAPDPIEYVLSQKLVHEPGKVFNYSGGLSQILAEVVKRTTGQEIDAFTEKHLFKPLGLTRYNWVKMRNGPPSAASGLRLRSRDMAKIGMLFLNKGKWNEKRLVSEKLIEDAMAEHIRLVLNDSRPGDIESYGYQLWRISTAINGTRFQRVEFSGNGGQKVQIDPTNRLMVVVTAGNYNKRDLKKSSFHFIEDFVYPALIDAKAAGTGKAK